MESISRSAAAIVSDKARTRAAFSVKVGLPLAALSEWNLRAERAFDLGAEGGEVEFVPIMKSAGQLGVFGRRKVKNAAADRRLDFEALAGGVGAGFAEGGKTGAGILTGMSGMGRVSTYCASASMYPPRLILAFDSISDHRGALLRRAHRAASGDGMKKHLLFSSAPDFSRQNDASVWKCGQTNLGPSNFG